MGRLKGSFLYPLAAETGFYRLVEVFGLVYISTSHARHPCRRRQPNLLVCHYGDRQRHNHHVVPGHAPKNRVSTPRNSCKAFAAHSPFRPSGVPERLRLSQTSVDLNRRL